MKCTQFPDNPDFLKLGDHHSSQSKYSLEGRPVGRKPTRGSSQVIMLRKHLSSSFVIKPQRGVPGRHWALHTLPIPAEQVLLMNAVQSFTSKYKATRNPEMSSCLSTLIQPREIINSHYLRCLSRLMDKIMLSYINESMNLFL